MYLLKLEWRKLASNSIFKVVLSMYIILLPLMFLAAESLFKEESTSMGQAMLSAHYRFPKIWDTMAYSASWLTFFLLTYLAVWMITSEYENKTARQNIITGITRNQYLLGKFQMLLVLIFGATVYMTLLSFIFGYLAGGFGSVIHHETWAIRNFFVQTFFYTSFAVMLAIIFKKSGLAMLVFFADLLIIERIIYYLLFLNILEIPAIGNYLPQSVAWFSLPFYLLKSNAMGLMEDIGDGKIPIMAEGTACGVAMIYAFLFWAISFWRYNKQDL